MLKIHPFVLQISGLKLQKRFNKKLKFHNDFNRYQLNCDKKLKNFDSILLRIKCVQNEIYYNAQPIVRFGIKPLTFILVVLSHKNQLNEIKYNSNQSSAIKHQEMFPKMLFCPTQVNAYVHSLFFDFILQFTHSFLRYYHRRTMNLPPLVSNCKIST